ncbi:MAG: hypothetical protein J2P20_08270 [Pseudonocardia sp.]|nr:hypothetical protein [Pseudonocardia sp.]
MSWQFRTVAVWRRYDNRARDYRWTASTSSEDVSGWEEILAGEAHDGWELVAACVDGYQEGNTSMEATGYRLFFKRPA